MSATADPSTAPPLPSHASESAAIGIALRGVVGGYGPLRILNGVDLVAPAGTITALVGPNGAGKSTVLKAIFGQADVTSGAVLLGGIDVTRASPRALLARGVAFVPQ